MDCHANMESPNFRSEVSSGSGYGDRVNDAINWSK